MRISDWSSDVCSSDLTLNRLLFPIGAGDLSSDLRYERSMSGTLSTSAPRDDDLRFYEERACQEKAAAEVASTPEIASAHRLLSIEYAAHACELRERLAAKQDLPNRKSAASGRRGS